MSQGVFQPIGQKRLTNVAVVRYKKMGKRFEVACYKNKILNWRNGVEKDLDEVLQTTTVFSNVSKGILAKAEDLAAVFGTTDEEKICIKLLAEGEVQVSDKERQVEYDSLFKDVASIISEKCINPETKRPYTITMIERALRDMHFSVDPHRGAKQQALEALPSLQKNIPIRRAQMRLKLQVPVAQENELLGIVTKEKGVVESTDFSVGQLSLVCLVEPGCFRTLHNYVQGLSGRVEVVALAATEEGDTQYQFDDARHSQAQQAKPTAQPAAQPATSRPSDAGAATSTSGFTAAHVEGPLRRSAAAETSGRAQPAGEVLYARGPAAAIPDQFESRRERFAELDTLQPGWQVELVGRTGGDTVDAIFYTPAGEKPKVTWLTSLHSMKLERLRNHV
ncbi:hypothetical protein WJX72_005065 [[Myrmecia] bisecta]|uniref:Uncharacterized protein n=1 Tax=[Myrmecia] bisecta TaxID=41462 RepID=A0AAW1PND3_9CHLO